MAGSSIAAETAAAKEKEKGKLADPAAAAAVVTTERVPASFVRRVRTNPTLLQRLQTLNDNLNRLVDLEENVMRQADAKGCAEVVVRYTDSGIKKIYPLPGY